MNDEELYRVVFSGQLTEEYDLKTTKRRFTDAFRHGAKRTEHLFSGKARAIKSNVTEEAAKDLAIKLLEIGCKCYVDPIPLSNDISKRPWFNERRKAVRRHRYRRDPRPRANVLDRRLGGGRRDDDKTLYANGMYFPGISAKR